MVRKFAADLRQLPKKDLAGGLPNNQERGIMRSQGICVGTGAVYLRDLPGAHALWSSLCRVVDRPDPFQCSAGHVCSLDAFIYTHQKHSYKEAKTLHRDSNIQDPGMFQMILCVSDTPTKSEGFPADVERLGVATAYYCNNVQSVFLGKKYIRRVYIKV